MEYTFWPAIRFDSSFLLVIGFLPDGFGVRESPHFSPILVNGMET